MAPPRPEGCHIACEGNVRSRVLRSCTSYGGRLWIVRVRLLGTIASCALAVAPASAWAAGGDAGATSAYLRADYQLVRVARSHLRASEAAPKALLAQVTRECPRAGEHSPQNLQSSKFNDEVIGAMVVSAGKQDVGAIKTFVRSVAGLRWSAGSVDAAVRSYVAHLRVLVTLKAPDVCADVRSWAASGFTVVPASTLSFDARFLPNWVALGLQPHGLARFESGEARALARTSARLESELSDGEARAVDTWGSIMNELVIVPGEGG